MLVLGLILAVYVTVRAIVPLRTTARWKVLLAAVTLGIALKFHLLHWVGGPMFFAPELPPLLLEVSAWLFAVLFIFFFLLFIANVVQGVDRLARFCLRRRKGAWPRATVNRLNGALFILALLLASAGFWEGARDPEVHRETLSLKRLPACADGMTVAVLADLHVDSMVRGGRLKRIVDATNALRPDLVVIVGDFVDGTVERRGADMRELSRLVAPDGVFGVPGNHEYYSGYGSWMRFLSGLGIRMLLNDHCSLPGRPGFVVAGVTDPVAAHLGGELPDVGKALEGVPSSSFRLLLAHQPVLAFDAAERGVDLQLSGHTHGGMILGIDRLVAAFNKGFVSGPYEVGKMKLLVSNGSGIWNGFPIRLGVAPEILLITLRCTE